MSTIISLEINLFLGNHLFNSENSDTNMMLSLLDRDVVSALSTNSFHPIVFSILKGISSQFAYVKLYDVSLPDDHPDNYYMEREWRCLKNVNFSLSDIHTIYLPNRSYQERFIKNSLSIQGNSISLKMQSKVIRARKARLFELRLFRKHPCAGRGGRSALPKLMRREIEV